MTDAAVNAAQIDYWNAVAGETWSKLQARLDRQLDPLGREALTALAPQPGEAILDIGCGCGQTSLELATAVGPGGQVLAVDISAPMLAVARSRPTSLDAAKVTWREADAQTTGFAPPPFDAVFSRFGVMFFADPTQAFANLRAATRPGGRLTFVCWRPLAENLWMRGPMEAAAHHLPPAEPPIPGAPGPFAFADPERVRRILTEASWPNIQLRPHDALIGAGSVEDSLTLALKVGPLGAALREAPDKAPQVIDAVRNFLSRHVGTDGVRLPAAVWIVTADNRA
jgi:SAM-dependent methyltransferase